MVMAIASCVVPLQVFRFGTANSTLESWQQGMVINHNNYDRKRTTLLTLVFLRGHNTDQAKCLVHGPWE
jgi:hypothetical protein